MRSDPLQANMLGWQYPIYPWISHVVRVFTPQLYTYTMTDIQYVNLSSGSDVLNSLNGDFTSGMVGNGVSGPDIPLGTTITGFTDAQHVILSGNATGNVVNGNAVMTSGATPTTGTGKLINGSADLSNVTGALLTQQDVGALVVGPDIPLGTIISNVNSPSDATMSNEATGSDSSATILIVEGTVQANIYLAYMQQWNPLLQLRDRELVYLYEPNGIVLRPGYYDARLVGVYNLLPLLVTWCCP